MNFDSFTIAEIRLMEDISGVSFRQIEKETTPIGGIFQAIIFVVARRMGKPLTLDEIDALSMKEAEPYFEGLYEGENPTN